LWATVKGSTWTSVHWHDRRKVLAGSWSGSEWHECRRGCRWGGGRWSWPQSRWRLCWRAARTTLRRCGRVVVACPCGNRRSGWSGPIRSSRSPTDRRSVAKATELRILDPPQLRRAASDLLRRGRGPLLVHSARFGEVWLSTAVHGNMAGTRATRSGCSGCCRRWRECLAQAVVLKVPVWTLTLTPRFIFSVPWHTTRGAVRRHASSRRAGADWVPHPRPPQRVPAKPLMGGTAGTMEPGRDVRRR